MKFYRNWVPLNVMESLLVLWLLVALIILGWLLWTERGLIRRWLTQKRQPPLSRTHRRRKRR